MGQPVSELPPPKWTEPQKLDKLNIIECVIPLCIWLGSSHLILF